MPPVIASTPPPAGTSPPAAAAAANPAYASCQSGQYSNNQPDLNLVTQNFCLIHI
jgi:hypothetical protein